MSHLSSVQTYQTNTSTSQFMSQQALPSRIKSRHCITENQTTLKRLHALNRGDPVAQRKARLEAEMLHQID